MTKNYDYEILPKRGKFYDCVLVRRKPGLMRLKEHLFVWTLHPAEIIYEGTYCECLFQLLRYKHQVNEESAKQEVHQA